MVGSILEGESLEDVIKKVEELFSMSFTISLVSNKKTYLRNSHECVVLTKLD